MAATDVIDSALNGTAPQAESGVSVAQLKRRRAGLLDELERARVSAYRIEGAVALIDELLAAGEKEAPCPASP